jgi:DNA-directed RNA polymerase specialized sigma24 family protein
MDDAAAAQIPVVASRAAPRASVDFPLLYKEQFAYAWKTLRRLGVLERDLPDVVHDLFVVVFRHWQDYDRSRPVKPWLFGIALSSVGRWTRCCARFPDRHRATPPDADRSRDGLGSRNPIPGVAAPQRPA